jgi:hypothetical protein
MNAKRITAATLLAIFLAAGGCSDNTVEPAPSSEQFIALTAPEHNAGYDLAACDGLTFAWSGGEGVGGYVLAFLSDDLSRTYEIAVGASPFGMTVADADALLEGLGVASEKEGTLHWTVKPATPSVNISTQLRTLRLRRLADSDKPFVVTRYEAQWDSLTVLKNPGKGWYHHYYDCGTWAYGIGGDGIGSNDAQRSDEWTLLPTFPGMDHLYIRLPWSYLEPQEGQFDWHLIDEAVNKYTPLGFGLAFRITCREAGAYPKQSGQQVDGINYATPKWVRDACGDCGTQVPKSDRTEPSWVPDYGNAVFLEKLDQFHRAFAARYARQPWFRYIDVGSVGDWGEGNFYTTEWLAYPSNEVLKRHIDIHLNHYRPEQLVLVDDFLVSNREGGNAGQYPPPAALQEMVTYAQSKGAIGLRDDSFLVDWYLQMWPQAWSCPRPYLYKAFFSRAPFVYELEHYSYALSNGHWIGQNGADPTAFGPSGATFMEQSMALAGASYIGYHGYLKDWLTRNPDFTKTIANRCGYWYFPKTAEYRQALTPVNNHLRVTWRNKGVARAYRTFALVLRFESAGAAFETVVPDAQNTEWVSHEEALGNAPTFNDVNKEYVAEYTYDLPSAMPRGHYRISMRLYDASTQTTVKVGIRPGYLVNEAVPIGEVTY